MFYSGYLDFIIKRTAIATTAIAVAFIVTVALNLQIKKITGERLELIKSFSKELQRSISETSEFFQWVLILLIPIFIVYLLIQTIYHYREINLPSALNLYQNLKDIGLTGKRKVIHDKFYKKVEDKTKKRIRIFYKNKVSIDLDKYRDNQEKIRQFFGHYGEVEIKEFGKKGVEILLTQLPNSIDFNNDMLKKEKIFYGIGKDGNYYLNFNELTHQIIVGQSGSGKSTLSHLIAQSLYFNIDEIEQLFLIDLKIVEFNRYENKEKTVFINDINGVQTVLTELKNIMNNRFSEMKENKKTFYSGKAIFVMIDEVGTIGTHHDKKLKDEIFKDMIDLLQKARAAKIYFNIFAQKIDSQNIPSNVLTNIASAVLMKTNSDFNINNSIGTKETVKKISNVEPENFLIGRVIIRNGITSELTLLQIPKI